MRVRRRIPLHDSPIDLVNKSIGASDLPSIGGGSSGLRTGCPSRNFPFFPVVMGDGGGGPAGGRGALSPSPRAVLACANSSGGGLAIGGLIPCVSVAAGGKEEGSPFPPSETDSIITAYVIRPTFLPFVRPSLSSR